MERFNLISPIKINELNFASSYPQSILIKGISRFEHSTSGDLSFCERLPNTELGFGGSGSIIMCTKSILETLVDLYPTVTCIPMIDPRAEFIDLGYRLLNDNKVEVSSMVPRPFGVHPSVKVGDHSIIHPETRIDEGAIIGAHCIIHRGTWIRDGAIIKDNTVIGVDGINAYSGQDGIKRRFPHFAGTIIGKKVEIGSNSVIVRGILNSTLIGHNTVIGNLSNIGHGVEIDENVWMSVGCLIGGHSRVGNSSTLGMGVSVKDNIIIGDNVQIGMGSVVVKTIKSNASVFGNPAKPIGLIQAGPVR